MITPNGYSKDTSIRPEGIVITWTRGMFGNHPWEATMKVVEASLSGDHCWPHRLKNGPRVEILYVYVIYENQIIFRCNYAGHVPHPDLYNLAYDAGFDMRFAHIILTGPIVKPDESIPLKGFRGFRYCTKLF